MAVRVGINGFGRIGRDGFTAPVLLKQQALEVVGVNEIPHTKKPAPPPKDESVHGPLPRHVWGHGENAAWHRKPY